MTSFALQARNRRIHLGSDSMNQQVISYVVVLMLLFFATRGYLPGMQDNALNNIGGQLYQLMLWLVGLVLMRSQLKAILRLSGKMKALTALALLAPISAIWSQLPEDSVRRGAFLILTTLFAFYLVRRFSPVQLAQMIVMAGVASGVLGIVICLVAPQVGVDPTGSWQGFFGQKNNCAQIMLFFLTAAIPFTFPTRIANLLRYVLFFVVAVLVVMSKAKTSWLLGPALILLFAIGSWLRKVRRRDATIVLAGLLVALIFFGALVPYVLPYVLDLLHKDTNLTGRVPLWQSAFLSILKRPLLGYGYSSFWTGQQGESLNVFMGAGFAIGQAQNGILEVWLELGLIGVVLVIASLVAAVRNAMVCFQYEHSPVVNWYVGIIALSVAYNVDETFLTTANCIGWLFYMVACTGLAVEAAKVRAFVRQQAKQRISERAGNRHNTLAEVLAQ